MMALLTGLVSESPLLLFAPLFFLFRSTQPSNPPFLPLFSQTGIYTTPVKDQEQCGSCWAFSATEQIESDIMRTLNTTFVLSPQQITSCDRTAMGCGGGWTEHAYNYVTRAGGIELAHDYPYHSGKGVTGECTSDDSDMVATISGFTTVDGEDNMASWMQDNGPLSVCLDASNFNSYTGGTVNVCGTTVNHCVQAVGVLPDDEKGYWKVRNSWGNDWGANGFIRLSYGSDTCAITNDATFTTGSSLLV
jgi:C1A family cysteine protease